MTARQLIADGPLPPLLPGTRVANELLRRQQSGGRHSYLMNARDVAQLIGVAQSVLVLWYLRTFGIARMTMDLRDLWGALRWPTAPQLRCFDLQGVTPRMVGSAERYDLLEVLEQNGWTVPTSLSSSATP